MVLNKQGNIAGVRRMTDVAGSPFFGSADVCEVKIHVAVAEFGGRRRPRFGDLGRFVATVAQLVMVQRKRLVKLSRVATGEQLRKVTAVGVVAVVTFSLRDRLVEYFAAGDLIFDAFVAI